MRGFLLVIFAIHIFAFSVVGQDNSDTSKVKSNSLVGVPTIGYNPSLGFEVGAMGMFIHHWSKKDTLSPPSMVFGMFKYWGSKSYFGLIGERFYFGKNKWRGYLFMGDCRINFQTYVPGLTFLPPIDFSTELSFYTASLSRQLAPKLYLGGSMLFNRIGTTFFFGENLSLDSLKQVNSLGIPVEYDSRNSVFYPTEGVYSSFSPSFAAKALGSTIIFNAIQLETNSFTSLTSNSIVVLRGYGYMAFGEVPFEGTRVVGDKDLRGYTKGVHRGDMIFDLQAEWRKSWTEHIGTVAFGGVAAAVRDGSNRGWSGLLPAVGVGGRYVLNKKDHINLGVDVAVGKEDWGVYVRLGEAF